MIYTVTFNPALDYTITIPDFQLGRVNRTTEELVLAGGKGINVSTVLHNLGMDSTILGFIAGFTGHEIQRRIREMQIPEQLIDLPDGMSRINIKLHSAEETDLNGMGPVISDSDLQLFYRQLDVLQSGDVLVLAGSIPSSLPVTAYQDILQQLESRDILTVVDATGHLLQNVLPYHPFLIKPNHHELGDLFGVSIQSRQEILPYAKKLQSQGARNVLVSMAGEGAALLTENGDYYEQDAPAGTVVNAVGAGDSMVAGFLYGYLTRQDYAHAFRLGIACGSASAFSSKLAVADEIWGVYDEQHCKTYPE